MTNLKPAQDAISNGFQKNLRRRVVVTNNIGLNLCCTCGLRYGCWWQHPITARTAGTPARR